MTDDEFKAQALEFAAYEAEERKKVAERNKNKMRENHLSDEENDLNVDGGARYYSSDSNTDNETEEQSTDEDKPVRPRAVGGGSKIPNVTSCDLMAEATRLQVPGTPVGLGGGASDHQLLYEPSSPSESSSDLHLKQTFGATGQKALDETGMVIKNTAVGRAFNTSGEKDLDITGVKGLDITDSSVV